MLGACSHAGDGGPVAPTGALFSKLGCVHVTPENIIPADFVGTVDNAYFPLKPGAHYVFHSQTDAGEEITDDTVTSDTKNILGVEAIVVHDLVSLNGSKIEETFDWYAQDTDGNVWYFGEDSRQFENGVQTGTEGSWEAGVDGAKAGIIMLACPKVGNAYDQGIPGGCRRGRRAHLGLSKPATVLRLVPVVPEDSRQLGARSRWQTSTSSMQGC